ncbi:MAG: dUTP diphosphatase [Candidatus Cloacimonetes bacterium]|jgi:dUTP pyrophosphatase|nr:dUTP diphosphatase [Candidatus Cloacimonadota bacterium]
MQVLIKKLDEKAIIPKRMTEHSAGYDLYSANQEAVILKKSQRILISTGIAIALPEGYEAQIRPRSGLAVKHGVSVLNSPGTIDADYRGEIKVILINHGDADFIIEPFSRIAQMIISKYETAVFELCLELPETIRGEGGFGSTHL